jgi:hypothetical protein
MGKKIEIPENILLLIISYTNYKIQKIITFNKRSIFHIIKNKLKFEENKEKIKIDNDKININIPDLPFLHY